MHPLVAIVGRPNVGKSTLFNRLIGRRRALVQDRPGITRDRQYGELLWDRYNFRILDTGGMELFNANRLQKKMADQALKAVDEADVLLVLMDAKTGLTAMDREWIEEIRKMNKPTLYVVNKVDDEKKERLMADFYELGVTPVYAVSSETGRGIGDLLDAVKNELLRVKGDTWKPVENVLPKDETDEEGEEDKKPDGMFRIAIIGRPNVGKSTLLNQLLGEERAIADETPGTTRDPVDSLYQYDGQTFHLVDTAGIRRRGRIEDSIEKFSVIKSLKTIERADLALLLLDGVEGLSEQDAHVAGEAFNQTKAMILLVNKWDQASKKTTIDEFKRTIDRQLHFMHFCPVLFISAKTAKGLEKLMPTVLRLKEQYQKRVSTSELNKVFETIVDNHPLPVFGGKNIKIYYATQTKANPPTFVVFSNQPSKIHFSYQRYLVNSIREAFDFKEVPIRILYRKKE